MVILGGSGSQSGVRARRSRRQSAPRDAARPREGEGALLHRARRRDAARVPHLAQARHRRRRDDRLRLRRALRSQVRSTAPGSPARRPAASPGAVAHWVLVPAHLARWLPATAYIGLIGAALLCSLARGPLRLALVVRRSTSRRSCGKNVNAQEPGAGALHRARSRC